MERIGEYLVKRLVGEGGMGKVYEAEERLSKRRVALKVLRPELTKNEEGRKLFLNEMRILAHLEHPNLVRSLSSIEDGDKLVMVLEYLSGRTLRDELVRRKRLPWAEAVGHIASIAEALAVAHEQSPPIVHRDLKPENVMLVCAEGEEAEGAPKGLKVMDFGVAKVLEAAHATNTQSIGTLQYMSPEQIDAGVIDARADLYALGLVFYELVSGEVPFHSASPRELLNLQCTAEPPELADDVRVGLPRGVETLMFSLLEKDPEKRPASARVVLDTLEPFRSAGEAAPRRRTTGALPKTDTERTSPPSGSATASKREPEAPSPAPRLDTVALVEKNAQAKPSREVPTWAGVLGIVLVSALSFAVTYRLRLSSNERNAASPSATLETAATPSSPR
ncbi:MAG: protein kinase [Myxococcales bacterium]|nr:protein kinase [Myxococcales bacterium]